MEERDRGEGGDCHKIRAMMAGMEMGGEEMDEGEKPEVKQEVVEAEVPGLGGRLLALKAKGLLTQDADPGGTTLVDACNGFIDLSRLAMLWVVYH